MPDASAAVEINHRDRLRNAAHACVSVAGQIGTGWPETPARRLLCGLRYPFRASSFENSEVLAMKDQADRSRGTRDLADALLALRDVRV